MLLNFFVNHDGFRYAIGQGCHGKPHLEVHQRAHFVRHVVGRDLVELGALERETGVGALLRDVRQPPTRADTCEATHVEIHAGQSAVCAVEPWPGFQRRSHAHSLAALTRQRWNPDVWDAVAKLVDGYGAP